MPNPKPLIVHCTPCNRDIDARGYGRHKDSAEHKENERKQRGTNKNVIHEVDKKEPYRDGYRSGFLDGLQFAKAS